MPLRILHVLSSNFFAGSVAYAIQLAERQSADGHEVFMVTDQAGLSDSFTCLTLPISDRSLVQRFRNILFLRRLIRERNISVVHAHSRAASWVSSHAVRGTRVPLVSTIHGRQVKHSRLKSARVYGDRVIAICPNLVEHLQQEIGIDQNKLEFLPNPLDFERLKQIRRTRPDDGQVLISVVGRFNGPKGEHFSLLVQYVFPLLLEKFPRLSLQMAGGEWDSFPQAGKKAFANLCSLYGERIRFVGFTSQPLQLMADSDLVIGAGRVALEALALGTPLYALGEACCHGLITPDNLVAAIGSNFGDILSVKSPFTPDTAAIAGELGSFLQGTLQPAPAAGLQAQYDLDTIMQNIIGIYRSAVMGRLSPKPIPILLYHRVPDTPPVTRHKTFVTTGNFEKQLRFFVQRRMQSITLKEYQAFANGDLPPEKFPRKPFILTFDDGYRDNFHNMLPLAVKYGFRGVLFILGDFSADGNFWDEGEDPQANRLMNTDQKRAFLDAGWEIGAHTLTHPDLTQLDDQTALYEISESKNCIEEVMQTGVISFAYPFGRYDRRIRELVRQCGFDFGIATDSGGIVIEDDRFALFRVNMFPEESLFSLYKKTSSWYRAYYRRKRGK